MSKLGKLGQSHMVAVNVFCSSIMGECVYVLPNRATEAKV